MPSDNSVAICPQNLVHASNVHALNPNLNVASSGSLKLPPLPALQSNGTFDIVNGVSINTRKPRRAELFDGPTKKICSKCGHFRSLTLGKFATDYPYKHPMNGCKVAESDYVDSEKRYQGWCECQLCQQGVWEINYPKPETLLSARKSKEDK